MPQPNGFETPAENHFRRMQMRTGEYMAYMQMATQGRREKEAVNKLLQSKNLTWDDLSKHFNMMMDLEWPND